ncbi:MAG TPA: UpxY family transcription antiterminator [Mariniphaga anaerophila]|uniref:UpxY family transcription antiterminator n=1 Tax=Mariniphaga anaerophila TaxID=1484053 RepID=A0A831L9Z3_9BACT|nr:UpxY family transcription antiterminator [Mariniphaga anaerophila]
MIHDAKINKNNSSENKVWYAVYTRSRTEKKVLAELEAKNIECFLPLQKQLRQWKDRKKWVEVPLIPGYCFVRITRKDYDRVLQIKNVVSYIIFERKAAVIPDNQIAYLRLVLSQSDFEVEVSFENFTPGEQVEIIQTPLMGLRGELADVHGKSRFIVRLNSINTVFMLDVPAEYLTKLPHEH